MFGQPAQTTSPFASPAATNTPFGRSVSTSFGSPAPAPFGATAAQPAAAAPTTGFGGFGSPAPAAAAPTSGFGAFGATAAPATTPGTTTTGFGGFGSTTPAPATTAFGAPAPAASTVTPFGAPAPAPATGGLFGAPAPAAGGGLFGAPAPAPTTGGFGSTTAAPATTGFGGFGATSTTAPAPAFGAGANTTPAFGAAPAAPATGGGLFGGGTTSAQAPAFGAAPAPATGGLFGGGTTPAPAAGGLFGSPTTPAGTTAAGGAAGTSAYPFEVTKKNDGATGINFQSITAMPQYETKCFEELRMEDYLAGNRGSQGQTTAAAGGAFGAPAPAAGGFGAPAPATGGLFGGGATPAPAPATGGLFGAPAPAPAAGGGLFGAPAAAAPAAGGLFGAPAPAPAAGGFFGAPAPAAGGGLFGAAAPKPATGGGLFGGGAAPAAPAPATGGLFGGGAAPAPATGGLFGAPAPAAPAPAGGLFGAPAAPAPATGGLFGAPAAPAAGGGLFGAPAPAAGGGLFGSPAPAPAAGGGLFGAPAAPAPAAGGLFGVPAPAPATGGLFGAPATAPAAGGGLFGAPAPATGGLFGAPAAPAAGGGLFGTAPAVNTAVSPGVGIAGAGLAGGGGTGAMMAPPTADTLLAQQLAAVESQKKELAVLEAWRGNSPRNGSGGSVRPVSSSYEKDGVSIRSTSRGLFAGSSGVMPLSRNYHSGPQSAAKIRPRGFGPVRVSNLGGGTASIGNGSSRTPIMSPERFLGSAAKKLVIKPGSLSTKPKTRLLLTNGEEEKDDNLTSPNGIIQRPAENGNVITEIREVHPDPLFDSPNATNQTGITSAPAVTFAPSVQQTPKTAESISTPRSTEKDQNQKDTPQANDDAYDFYRAVVGSPEASTGTTDDSNSAVPKLTKAGYVVSPSLDVLSQMSEADLAAVSGFSVEREGYAKVAWDGAVDVRGVDLDTIINIQSKDVTVYHNEENSGTKPAVGSKLNRPAVITIAGIFPKSTESDEAIKKYERKIERTTKNMGATLLSYDSSTGVWEFRVAHFSRYGLIDDDSDEEEEDREKQTNKNQAEIRPDFGEGERGGRSPGKLMEKDKSPTGGASRIRLMDDEEMSNGSEEEIGALVTDSEDQVMQAAENAYAMLDESEFTGGELESKEKDEVQYFDDEGDAGREYLPDDVVPPPTQIAPSTLKSVGICARIARKCDVKTASSSKTDFGMRMGCSFRVGWRPDGSFIYPDNFSQDHERENKILISSHPALIQNASSKPISEKEMCTDLLSVHLKHGKRLITDYDCPIYTLSDDTITSEQENNINLILNDYEEEAVRRSASNKEDFVSKLIAQVFTLIPILFGPSDSNNSRQFSLQRTQAFKNWLQRACADDVERDISLAIGENDVYVAIFSALSGNNVSKAQSIAAENGLVMLSSMLANSNSQSCSELRHQMDVWDESNASSHCPNTLIRVYSLLSCNLDLEEKLYKDFSPNTGAQVLDWKRRLGMLMWNIDHRPRKLESEIASLVLQYNSDIDRGVSPSPHAWYIHSKAQSPEICLLYRLLELKTGAANTRLSYITSPTGHTSDKNDFSKAFHFASILSLFDVCEPLTDVQEAQLLESYASQLISTGAWEWAVYVLLCTFGASIGKGIAEKRRSMALNVVLRCFTNESEAAPMKNKKRSFLQDEVGIPNSWFELALGYEALHRFNPSLYVQHIANYSIDDALSVYEEVLLPDLLFEGGLKNCQNIIEFFEAIGCNEMDWDDSRLSGVVYNYLTLSRDVYSSFLSASNTEPLDDGLDELIEKAEQLQGAISSLNAKKSLHHYDRINRVSQDLCLAEMTSALLVILVHLKSLKSGGSLYENLEGMQHNRKMKKTSELCSFWFDKDQDLTLPSNVSEILGSRTILRGAYGAR